MQELGRGLRIEKELIHLFDITPHYVVSPICRSQYTCRCEQLHCISQCSLFSNFAQLGKRLFINIGTFNLCPDGKDLHHLFSCVRHSADNHQTVKKIDRQTVGRYELRSSHGAHSSVCRKDNNGRQCGLECLIQVGEALNIEHVYLIHEEYTGHKLSNTLINVLVDHLVDLHSQFLGDFSLLRLHHLPHQRHNVLTTLGFSVGVVQIMEGHILHDLLLLMHLSFWYRYVLLCLKVILGGVRVRAPNSLYCPAVCLDVDDITDGNLFFLQPFINARIKLQLLATLSCLQPNEDVRDALAVANSIITFDRGELGYLSLVYLLVLLDAKANGAAEVLHQHLGFLHLRRVHL
mmetsp:Transcript_20953/g.54113  ORF Transcript_20953/g.54113 Transcript_20953/m.54113 type:complete len:348 (-) Transcript_20953:545-1588(-)